MTERITNVQVVGIEHPESGLMLELKTSLMRMRHMYSEVLINALNKRVEAHQEECGRCAELVRIEIKFY